MPFSTFRRSNASASLFDVGHGVRQSGHFDFLGTNFLAHESQTGLQQQSNIVEDAFGFQSSKQIGHRGVPLQCSDSRAGAVVAVAAAAAALARATSARPRAGPATTGGAAFAFGDGAGVVAASPDAPSAAAAALASTRRLHSFLWPRSFQSTVWHSTEQ